VLVVEVGNAASLVVVGRDLKHQDEKMAVFRGGLLREFEHYS